VVEAPDGLLILPDFTTDTPGDSPRPGWGYASSAQRWLMWANTPPYARNVQTAAKERRQAGSFPPGLSMDTLILYSVLAHVIPLAKSPSGFWPFKESFWWPWVEDPLDHPMIQAATDMQCSRMLACEVTGFCDILAAPSALLGCISLQAEVVQGHGIRSSCRLRLPSG